MPSPTRDMSHMEVHETDSRILWIVISLIFISLDFRLCYSANLQVVLANSASNSLYDPTDEVTIFDGPEQLKSTVYGSQQAWFVQFYSSWCGHCIHFAPVWKSFAQDVKGWQTVAKIGVVNCADSINSKLCSQYVDIGFPTLRLFKAFQKNGTGDVSNGPRDVDNLRHSLIDHISNHSLEQRPSHWPTLSPVGINWLLNFFSQNDRPSVEFFAVVFEEEKSYVGRELILDASANQWKDIEAVRVLSQELIRNPLPHPWRVTEWPSLFILKSDGQPSEIWRNGDRKTFYTALQTYIEKTVLKVKAKGQEKSNKNDKVEPIPTSAGNKGRWNREPNIGPKKFHEQRKTSIKNKMNTSQARTAVYMQDLESTLIYSLKHEIGLQRLINGDALVALKSYIAVLSKYFPGQPDTMNALHKLQVLLEPSTQLTNKDWFGMVEQLQNSRDSGKFLMNEVKWIGCRGSKPVFRGYPCGLWVLFHTLTVSHAGTSSLYLESDSKEVLRAMKGYIQFFFGCLECSNNFSKESANLESGIGTVDESILWLWQTHNRVNKRLAGQLSEDPQHRKIEFPSNFDCPTCRHHDPQNKWNNSAVLHYLKELYSFRNLVYTADKVDSGFRRDFPRDVNSKLVKAHAVQPYWYFNSGMDARDLSMCLMLYTLCAALLLVIYIYVRHRRRRKNSKYVI